MKYTKIFLFTLFAILLVASYSFGQKSPSKNSKSKVHTNKNQIEIPKGWKLIDLDSFSFILPESMEDKKVIGDDSEVWKFASDEMELHIDSGLYKVDLDSNSKLYETKTGWIQSNGIKGKYFRTDFTNPKSIKDNLDNSSEDSEQKPFLNGITFYRGENFYSSFWVSFETKEQSKIADKILQSIKFKK